MSLSEQILLMKQDLENVERELKSLEGGRKASAPRARKSLQNLKTSSHALRKQIVEHTKSLPIKKRTKKEPVQNPEDFKPEPAPEQEPAPEEPKASTKKAKPRKKKSVE